VYFFLLSQILIREFTVLFLQKTIKNPDNQQLNHCMSKFKIFFWDLFLQTQSYHLFLHSKSRRGSSDG